MEWRVTEDVDPYKIFNVSSAQRLEKRIFTKPIYKRQKSVYNIEDKTYDREETLMVCPREVPPKAVSGMQRRELVRP